MNTREKIKAAAGNFFAEKGYEGTALSMIAQEVGIKTPSIYAFFKNKESLFLEVYRDLLEDHFLHLEKIVSTYEQQPPKEKLYNILIGIMDYHMREKDKTKLYMRVALFPPESLKDEMEQAFIKTENLQKKVLWDIFQQGIKTGDFIDRPIEEYIISFLCLMDGLFLELFYYHPTDFFNRLNIVWNQFLSGIEKQ